MDRKTTVIVATVAVLVVVAAVVVIDRFFGSSDEDSIRVRNGSMEIETVDGLWNSDGSDEYTNENPGKKPRDQQGVMVHFKTSNAICSGVGRSVVVTFIDEANGSFEADASFTVKGNGSTGNPFRTKVKVKNKTKTWHLVSSSRLLYDFEGGNVSDVTLDGSHLKIDGTQTDCTLTKSNLDFIAICARAACKPPKT